MNTDMSMIAQRSALAGPYCPIDRYEYSTTELCECFVSALATGQNLTLRMQTLLVARRWINEMGLDAALEQMIEQLATTAGLDLAYIDLERVRETARTVVTATVLNPDPVTARMFINHGL